MTLADWRRQTAINLDGVFLSVKYGLPLMRKTGGGSVIMMSSLAGLRGAAGLSGYCATKGGVRLFAKAVAMECASFGDGIRVNSVHPGIIDTPIWGKIPTGAAAAARTRRSIRRSAPNSQRRWPRRAGGGDRAGRAVSGFRCVALRDRDELVIDGGMNARRRGAEGVTDFNPVAMTVNWPPCLSAPAPSARHSRPPAICPSWSENP